MENPPRGKALIAGAIVIIAVVCARVGYVFSNDLSDVMEPVCQLLMVILGAVVTLREYHKQREVLFIALFVTLGVGAFVFDVLDRRSAGAGVLWEAATRDYREERRATLDDKRYRDLKGELQKPPVPRQTAFVSVRPHLETFVEGDLITVRANAVNSGTTPANKFGGHVKLYIVETEPMVSSTTERKKFAEFREEFKQLVGSGVLDSENKDRFGTAWGPLLDRPLRDELTQGSKAILFVAWYVWEDRAGAYNRESCTWLQPGLWAAQKGGAAIWHDCHEHNGSRRR